MKFMSKGNDILVTPSERLCATKFEMEFAILNSYLWKDPL
jgi:hypothetical protein